MPIQVFNSQHSEMMNLTYWVNEKIIANNQLNLHESESIADIYSIKNIFMTIVSGRIALQLNDQEEQVYATGNVVEIPSRTKMNLKNLSSDKMAILVMKL
jgi:hypothetical protein